MNEAAVIWAVENMDELTPSERSVFLAIAQHVSDQWVASLPTPAIAEAANVSVRRCYGHIDRLEAVGVLVKEHNEDWVPGGPAARFTYALTGN